MRLATLAPLAALVTSCTLDLEASDFRHEVSMHVVDAAETSARMINSIDAAERTLDVALPVLTDTNISDAIVRAKERGVALRVITDIDQAGDAGVVALVAAEVPLRLADGALSYFDFNINTNVTFASEEVRMSHAWVLVDEERATLASYAGSLDAGNRTVFELRGEDLLEDLWTEHNQVFGGSDATATTAFDDSAKSIADFRWLYPTDSQMALEIWFGPQERLTKRMIDAVYSAKSTIWVSSDQIINEGLIRALEYKARDGFDVRVLVGDKQAVQFNPRTPPALLATETPNVSKRRLTGEVLPTMLLIDYEIARDGNNYPTRAFMLSHDMVSASRLFQQTTVANDQLIDGNLMVLNDWKADLHPDMVELRTLFESMYDRGGDL